MVVSEDMIHDVKQSYGRCCIKPEFWDRFYENFLASSPKVAEKFAHTDMAKQKTVLKGSLNFVIMYAQRAEGMAKTKLEQIGEMHDRQHHNVEPADYPLWENSLLKTLETLDPQFSPELKQKWHQVLKPAIDLLKSKY